jgi:hypothetical protein
MAYRDLPLLGSRVPPSPESPFERRLHQKFTLDRIWFPLGMGFVILVHVLRSKGLI